jgi:hypothetical protein
MPSECLCRCSEVDVNEVGVLIFTNRELGLSLDEELDVHLIYSLQDS